MTTAEERLYGNWRVGRGFGIGSLGTGQTLTLAAAVIVPVLGLSIGGLAIAVPLGVVAVLLIVVTVVPLGDTTMATVVLRRLRFTHAKAAGYTEATGGVLVDHPRRHDLPGPMAPIVALDIDDGLGGRQGLLWDRRTGLLTTVLRVSPVGLHLADRHDADTWVASWGVFLASLGYQPMIRHIAVTVDTAPNGGTTVRDYVTTRLHPDAPPAAVQVMSNLVDSTPATSADVDTRVAVTFDPSRSPTRPRTLLDAATEVVRWLPGIEAGLAETGVSVMGRASVGWLTGRLRISYDPAARAEVAGIPERSPNHLLAWSDAAPIRASESWDHWRHDSGISVSWAMREAPRQAVPARVLTPLLAPGRWPRRVTLFYKPFTAEQAAHQVEAQIADLELRQGFARRTKRDETQRDRDDQAKARQAAREESQGAGVGQFSLYVTTTVLTESELPAATADVEQRAGQSKILLRRLRGAQSAGFAAALGLGIDPAELERRRSR